MRPHTCFHCRFIPFVQPNFLNATVAFCHQSLLLSGWPQQSTSQKSGHMEEDRPRDEERTWILTQERLTEEIIFLFCHHEHQADEHSLLWDFLECFMTTIIIIHQHYPSIKKTFLEVFSHHRACFTSIPVTSPTVRLRSFPLSKSLALVHSSIQLCCT